METSKLRIIFFLTIPFLHAVAFAAQTNKPVSKPAPKQEHLRQKEDESLPIRKSRPITLSASLLGKTPLFGASVDANLIPNLAFGAGYGYFNAATVSGNLIPIYLMGYFLQSNFSPFVEAGANFITVKFESSNSLLKSTFQGTQLMVGAGAEYRFDFGLNIRADIIRYIHAKLWAPGLAVGYSVFVE